MKNALRSLFVCLVFGGLGFVLASIIWSVALALWNDAWQLNFPGIILWLVVEILLLIVLVIYVPVLGEQVLHDKKYEESEVSYGWFGLAYIKAKDGEDPDDEDVVSNREAFSVIFSTLAIGLVLYSFRSVDLGGIWGILTGPTSSGKFPLLVSGTLLVASSILWVKGIAGYIRTNWYTYV